VKAKELWACCTYQVLAPNIQNSLGKTYNYPVKAEKLFFGKLV
jgi:hypothetical protein